MHVFNRLFCIIHKTFLAIFNLQNIPSYAKKSFYILQVLVLHIRKLQLKLLQITEQNRVFAENNKILTENLQLSIKNLVDREKTLQLELEKCQSKIISADEYIQLTLQYIVIGNPKTPDLRFKCKYEDCTETFTQSSSRNTHMRKQHLKLYESTALRTCSNQKCAYTFYSIFCKERHEKANSCDFLIMMRGERPYVPEPADVSIWTYLSFRHS